MVRRWIVALGPAIIAGSLIVSPAKAATCFICEANACAFGSWGNTGCLTMPENEGCLVSGSRCLQQAVYFDLEGTDTKIAWLRKCNSETEERQKGIEGTLRGDPRPPQVEDKA